MRWWSAHRQTAATLLAALLSVGVPAAGGWAEQSKVCEGQPAASCDSQGPAVTAQEGIGVAGSVSNSTITNTINHENPQTLRELTQAYKQLHETDTQLGEFKAKVAELADKLRFSSNAVSQFFKTLGEQNVPEDNLQARLIEIATQYAQTRDALAALKPKDPRAAELTQSAQQALDAGRPTEADAQLGQAKDIEKAALLQARELRQQAQEAEDQHALNLAKIEATQGGIALTQLLYTDAAAHFKEAAELVSSRHPDVMNDYLNRRSKALEEYKSDQEAQKMYPAFKRTRKLYSPDGLKAELHYLENPKSAIEYYSRCQIYSEARRFEDAVADCTKSIELSPDDPLNLNERGWIFLLTKHYREAIQDLSAAIKLNPDFPKALSNRGWAYHSLGDNIRALSDFSRLIEAHPYLDTAYADRCQIFTSLKRYKDALLDCNKAIVMNKKNPVFYEARADLFNALGDKSHAQLDQTYASALDR
jgi:tetratricopeptide (TPR) repeat protein